MMSRDLGGIQQVYIDYSDALKMQNHEVFNISSERAQINQKLTNSFKLPNFGSWCILSKILLRRLVKIYRPQVIICHGNRAINFAQAFKAKDVIIIGVSHNYSYKHLTKCDYILTLTEQLKNHLIKQNFAEHKLLLMPNMTRVTNAYKAVPFKSPVVIGSMGRLIKNKGLVYLVEAISILKHRGHEIKLAIGGDGEEKENLTKQVQELGIQEEVLFLGWIKNQTSFFQKIDIFCSSSVLEPFGLNIIEAMEHSRPVVVTKSGGPTEIIRHYKDGLVSESGSALDLANNLEMLLNNQELAHQFAKSAYSRVLTHYDIATVSKKLSQLLIEVQR